LQFIKKWCIMILLLLEKVNLYEIIKRHTCNFKELWKY
jgi:hypothetical protein